MKKNKINEFNNCDQCKYHNPTTDYCSKAKTIIPSGSHVCSGYEYDKESVEGLKQRNGK